MYYSVLLPFVTHHPCIHNFSYGHPLPIVAMRLSCSSPCSLQPKNMYKQKTCVNLRMPQIAISPQVLDRPTLTYHCAIYANLRRRRERYILFCTTPPPSRPTIPLHFLVNENTPCGVATRGSNFFHDFSISNGREGMAGMEVVGCPFRTSILQCWGKILYVVTRGAQTFFCFFNF